MSYTKDIKDIQDLPHYREVTCMNCGNKQKAYILEIQTNCLNCGSRIKLRGYGAIGSEIEDVIDEVLAWIGKDDEFDAAMTRKRIIDSDAG